MKKKLVFLLFVLSFLVLNACGEIPEESETEKKEKIEFGEIGIDPPSDWELFQKVGKYCVYLPTRFEQKENENKNSPLQQFRGDLGVVSVDYGNFSAGQQVETNASVEDNPVAIRITEPIENFPGYFGADRVYSMYWKINDSVSFDITYYGIGEGHREMALNIFGAARAAKDCL